MIFQDPFSFLALVKIGNASCFNKKSKSQWFDINLLITHILIQCRLVGGEMGEGPVPYGHLGT